MLACCLGFVPLTEVSGFLSFFQRSKEVEVAKNERKEKPTLSLSLSLLKQLSRSSLVVPAQQMTQQAHKQEAERGHAEAEHGA